MNRAAFAIHHNKIKTAPAPTETVYISEDMRLKSKNIVSSSGQSRKRNISSYAGCYFCTNFKYILQKESDANARKNTAVCHIYPRLHI